MTPTYADLAASPWLHGVDLKGKTVTLTIESVDMTVFESVRKVDGEDVNVREVQGTLAFAGKTKKLGLNRTNRECLRVMFGPASVNDYATVDLNELWAGKRVTLYPSPERNPATKQVEPAVRVKGSPDIDRAITFDLVLPRKRPKSVTLEKTPARSQSSSSPNAPTDPSQPLTGGPDND